MSEIAHFVDVLRRGDRMRWDLGKLRDAIANAGPECVSIVVEIVGIEVEQPGNTRRVYLTPVKVTADA